MQDFQLVTRKVCEHVCADHSANLHMERHPISFWSPTFCTQKSRRLPVLDAFFLLKNYKMLIGSG